MFNNPTINKSEYYSFGHIYRRWANLNKVFPLLLNGAHGIVKGPIESKSFNSNFRYFIVHNSRILIECESLNFRTIKCPHPYVLFKILENKHRTTAVEGGIYFLSHTISGLSIDYKFDNILEGLKRARSTVGRITVCIYYLDWDNCRDFFERNGFNTVCLGAPMDDSFVYKLYELLSQNTVILDDSLGSHVFYGVDFGLKIWRFRETDDYEFQSESDLHDEIFVRKLQEIFPVTKEPTISEIQMEFVRKEMGYDYLGIGRFNFKLRLVWAVTWTYLRLLNKTFRN